MKSSRSGKSFEADKVKRLNIYKEDNHESYSESIDGNESQETEDQKIKNVRQRKRKVFNQVRDQMEFYFSDANLTKDRFLMQLIKENPYVSLDVFLEFNKIKNLIKTTDDLVKAIKKSTKLELNDSKTHVCRIKPLPNPDVSADADQRTIYVESLPSNADHDWVKKVFQQYSGGGNVTYVSLPKYRNSTKIKEFGFIEYESGASVEKCLKSFQNFDGIICPQTFDPSNLISIKSFIKEQEINKQLQKSKNKKSIENVKKNLNNKNTLEDDSNDSNDSCEPPSSKRTKLELNGIKSTKNIDIDSQSDGNDDETDDKFGESTDLDEKCNSDDEMDHEKKKKTRKKKKKDKKIKKPKSTEGKTKELNMDADVRDLKILPKIEWKRLRNKYLNTQREKIAMLKRKSHHQSEHGKNIRKDKAISLKVKNDFSKFNQQMPTIQSSSKSQLPVSVALSRSNFEIKKSPHHMNFYRVNKEIDGNYDEDETDDKNNYDLDKQTTNNSSIYSVPEKRRKLISPSSSLSSNQRCLNTLKNKEPKRNIAAEKSPTFQYESGIIIKINFTEPCVDVKSFKTDMKQYDYVKYIDIKEGSMEAHLRCDSNKNAQLLCKQVKTSDFQGTILVGTDESKYWDKITKDREMKLNKKINTKPKRGREKIPKLVSNHIRFGDVDE